MTDDGNAPEQPADEDVDTTTTTGAGPAVDKPKSRRRLLPIVLGIAALIAAVVAVALVLAPSDEKEVAASEPAYTDEVHDVFVASCAADGGEPVKPVCECFYEGIVAEIPYDRYQQVNELLLASPPASGEPLQLPDEFDAILTDCRRSTTTPSP